MSTSIVTHAIHPSSHAARTAGWIVPSAIVALLGAALLWSVRPEWAYCIEDLRCDSGVTSEPAFLVSALLAGLLAAIVVVAAVDRDGLLLGVLIGLCAGLVAAIPVGLVLTAVWPSPVADLPLY